MRGPLPACRAAFAVQIGGVARVRQEPG